MPLVKKIKESWKPAENRNLQVGETIFMSDAARLLQTGTVVLVDEVTGEELPQSPTMSCPVCAYTTEKLIDLQKHLATHTAKVASDKTYKCKKCDFEADKPLTLAVHVKKEHKT